MKDQGYFYGTGRRKCAVARVRLVSGNGAIVINGRPVEELFPRSEHQKTIQAPLQTTGTLEKYNAMIKVVGGGVSGQAGAIRHGISRALCENNPGHRAVLKAAGLLTRDARQVERKKCGQPGARKRFQFSKR